MGWTRVLLQVTASLVGLSAGAAIDDGVKAEKERDREAASSLESLGIGASGPGFYVWDEDPVEARRWAEELARSAVLKDDDFG